MKGGNLLLISGVKGSFPKRCPVGIYDSNILCFDCEKKFSDFDDYGTSILLKNFTKNFSAMVNPANNRLLGYESSTIDQLKLLKFLISILWRASVSQSGFYSNVYLGKHEELARQIILNQSSNIPTIFKAVLSTWHHDAEFEVLKNQILDPRRSKVKGINTYSFYLGKIIAQIKVDSRNFTHPFSKIELMAQKEVFIFERKVSSKELIVIQNILSNSNFKSKKY